MKKKESDKKNPYASEKIPGKLYYPKGYKPLSVKKQLEILQKYLGKSFVYKDGKDKKWPDNADSDGLYVIPKPTSLAKHLKIRDHWNNFGVLIEKGPLTALGKKMGARFANHMSVSNDFSPEKFRLVEATKIALQKLEAEQEGDFLVFPAQTGKLYGGHSPRNARFRSEHAKGQKQWALSSYCVAWMLFTNPHRLTDSEHQHIDCPGDQWKIDKNEGFVNTTYLEYRCGVRLHCYGRNEKTLFDCYGSSSGFLRA